MIYPSVNAYDLAERNDIGDRTILDNEIVIENDLPSVMDNYNLAEMACKKLNENGYCYSVWFSGGKSFHIHILFNELLKAKNGSQLKKMKEQFYCWLYDVKSIHDKKITDNQLDVGLAGKHMIRCEYSMHQKTGKDKKMVIDAHSDYDNLLPTHILKIADESLPKLLNIKCGHISSIRPCMRFMFNNIFKDHRKKITYILVTNLMKQYKFELVNDMLNEWSERNNCIGNTNSTLRSHYHHTYEGIPGCPYIQEHILLPLKQLKLCVLCNRELEAPDKLKKLMAVEESNEDKLKRWMK